MFTGIVEELGEIVAVDRLDRSAVVRVRGPRVVGDAVHGASIAVNGVCLTVVEHDDEVFTVDVMAETLDRSSLAGLRPGDRVNLERAVPAGGRLGGHIVQGHVDGTGTVTRVEPGERWTVITIGLPHRLARYVAEKGSIAVDGVSLTVAGVAADAFTVSLIPTTLETTLLGQAQVGDTVNLEVDVIAKYVERLTATDGAVR